jgi:hypothetical protein
MITNKKFLFSSEDKSLNYEVEFIQGHPLKSTHLGKTWAKRTQCVVKVNGFIKDIHYVTKHNADKDDLRYAYINAFRPIKHHLYKEARTDITNQILEFTKL